jgi:hypothetical protein
MTGHIKSHWGTYIVAIGMIIIIAVLGYLFYQKNSGTAGNNLDAGGDTAAQDANTEFAGLTDTGPVARVNGRNISRERFNISLAQYINAAQDQNADLNDATLQQQLVEQALNAVLNTEVLVQNAEQAGITVSADAIEQEVTAIRGRFDSTEAYQTELAVYLLTESSLREKLWEELMMNQYLATQADFAAVSATTAEVDALIASVRAAGGQLPPESEIRIRGEEQVIINKQQTIIENILLALREKSAIEILI